jgi:hypothetical protein
MKIKYFILMLLVVFPGFLDCEIKSPAFEELQSREMELVEVDLFLSTGEDLNVTGYSYNYNTLTKLPIGSTLDKVDGKFFWSPGPGFVGEYRFLFNSETLNMEKELNIVILPKYGDMIEEQDIPRISRIHAASSNPFGDFSTPIDGSTVMSSIAVTGWALDDSGIEHVKVYCGEVDNLVYVGDAVLVEGARPDVAAAYPDYPDNTKAGWGYMLLTNFLPNGGNGTFKLWAIATAKDGEETTLGSKTIYADNANAVKPFGAIDTPTQGGIASGKNFINWGWVLTPQPNQIPTNGSTINVYVNGVKIGNPTYNIYREDIATLLPGYTNSNGAVGYFYLDTTKYADGVHTIQWTATDNAGNTDGIGSRYFSIPIQLHVTKGVGVDGTPNSGTYSYDAGSVVSYNYSLQTGYKNLVVKLDGNTVASSGSVIMNTNHTLTSICQKGAVTYNHLLLVYPKTSAAYKKEGQDKYYEGSIDDTTKNAAINAFKNLPNLITDGSNSIVSTKYDIVVIDHPITKLSVLFGDYYWLSPNDIHADLSLYAPNRKYDSVHVLWNNGPIDTYWGLGGVFINNGTSTYDSIIFGYDWWWTGPGEYYGGVFLHEWLHGVCRFYESLGYDMPDGDADGAEAHGYSHSNTEGWMPYYRDLMRGKVWEPKKSKYTGITKAAWFHATPSNYVGSSALDRLPPTRGYSNNKCLGFYSRLNNQ